MAKRELTRRQTWRIKKIQEQRLERARRKADRPEQHLDDSHLDPEQTGLVIASYGASVDVEAEDGSLYRCLLRRNLETPVVGDHAVWQAEVGREHGGVVVALGPRHNQLARPDASGALKILAANIDQLLVVVAPFPSHSTELIDHYLVAAETTGIHPLILCNKADLLTDEVRQKLEQDFDRYRAIDYPIIYASTKTEHGLDLLKKHLQGKTSVFAGQSGVGKTSLVKALLPGTEIKVGELSKTTGLGQHTTSASRLFHLPKGGDIIDSPGVREFRLWDLARQELAAGFIEFRPYLGKCRFRDCRHDREPGCALRQAVAENHISAERFHRFLAIAEELERQKLK